jgi:hypothetical protein
MMHYVIVIWFDEVEIWIIINIWLNVEARIIMWTGILVQNLLVNAQLMVSVFDSTYHIIKPFCYFLWYKISISE